MEACRIVAGTREVASDSVDVSPMPDPHHYDPQDLILDLVENAVIRLADPIPLLPRELLDTDGTGIVGESLNARGNAPPILRSNLGEFLGGGPLDLETITCHAASGP